MPNLFICFTLQDVKPEHVSLRVTNQDGSSVTFKIKKHASLKKLMNAYCSRAVSQGSIWFTSGVIEFIWSDCGSIQEFYSCIVWPALTASNPPKTCSLKLSNFSQALFIYCCATDTMLLAKIIPLINRKFSIQELWSRSIPLSHCYDATDTVELTIQFPLYCRV